MKFCDDHWSKLRTAIAARGLDSLVAQNGVRAARNLADEMSSGASLRNFDPLMTAHWRIVSNVCALAQGVALDLMSPRPDGTHWCPLCYANAQNPYGYNYDVWIDRAADDALAERNRLLSEEQIQRETP